MKTLYSKTVKTKLCRDIYTINYINHRRKSKEITIKAITHFRKGAY